MAHQVGMRRNARPVRPGSFCLAVTRCGAGRSPAARRGSAVRRQGGQGSGAQGVGRLKGAPCRRAFSAAMARPRPLASLRMRATTSIAKRPKTCGSTPAWAPGPLSATVPAGLGLQGAQRPVLDFEGGDRCVERPPQVSEFGVAGHGDTGIPGSPPYARRGPQSAHREQHPAGREEGGHQGEGDDGQDPRQRGGDRGAGAVLLCRRREGRVQPVRAVSGTATAATKGRAEREEEGRSEEKRDGRRCVADRGARGCCSCPHRTARRAPSALQGALRP